MARLQRLHAAAEHLAAEAPEVLANADAARGLERSWSRPWPPVSSRRKSRKTDRLSAGTSKSCGGSMLS